MNSEFVGADPVKMAELESVLRDGAEQLSGVHFAVAQAVQALHSIWRGDVTDAFAHVWHSRHAVTIAAAQGALQDAADTVKRNLDAQIATSDTLEGGSRTPGGGQRAEPYHYGRPPSFIDGVEDSVPLDGTFFEQHKYWDSLSDEQQRLLIKHRPDLLLQMTQLNPSTHDLARQQVRSEGLQHDDVQTIHNGYHFGELKDQYEDGFRGFEFDAHHSDDPNDHDVLHGGLDRKSYIDGLRDGLNDIAALESSEPTFVFVDLKDELDESLRHYVPEGSVHQDAHDHSAVHLDRLLVEELGRENIFTPHDHLLWAQEIDPSIETQAEAHAELGWPPQEHLEGRTMVVLTDNTGRYDGNTAFVASGYPNPTTPIVNVNEHDITASQIAELQEQGHLVRTYPDGRYLGVENPLNGLWRGTEPHKGENFKAIDPPH